MIKQIFCQEKRRNLRRLKKRNDSSETSRSITKHVITRLYFFLLFNEITKITIKTKHSLSSFTKRKKIKKSRTKRK